MQYFCIQILPDFADFCDFQDQIMFCKTCQSLSRFYEFNIFLIKCLCWSIPPVTSFVVVSMVDKDYWRFDEIKNSVNSGCESFRIYFRTLTFPEISRFGMKLLVLDFFRKFVLFNKRTHGSHDLPLSVFIRCCKQNLKQENSYSEKRLPCRYNRNF